MKVLHEFRTEGALRAPRKLRIVQESDGLWIEIAGPGGLIAVAKMPDELQRRLNLQEAPLIL